MRRCGQCDAAAWEFAKDYALAHAAMEVREFMERLAPVMGSIDELREDVAKCQMSEAKETLNQITDIYFAIIELRETAIESVREALRAGRKERALPNTPPPHPQILCDYRHNNPTIYALVDPEDKERIRYVGQSKAPGARYASHCSRQAAPAVRKWIKSLGPTSPLMLLIETCHQLELNEREQYWIQFYQERGMADLNRTPGGTNSRKPKPFDAAEVAKWILRTDAEEAA